MEVWLFILGYLIHFAASCVLLYKIHQQGTVYGLSIDTQICFLIATISRCVWYLDTRLVETWVAYLELVCSTVASLALTYYLYAFRHTNRKAPWMPFRAVFLLPATLLVAFLIHPGRNWWSVQVLVAFTIYAEAVGLLPQLYLMRHMLEVEPLTSHYVGLLVLSRVVRLFFWVTLFLQGVEGLQGQKIHVLFPQKENQSFAFAAASLYFSHQDQSASLREHFVGLFLADLLHSILAADYFVVWCRKLRHGGALIYKI